MPKRSEIKEELQEILGDMTRELENMRRYYTGKIVTLYGLIERVKKLEKLNNGDK